MANDAFSMSATGRRALKRKRDGQDHRATGGVVEDFTFSNFEFTADSQKKRRMEGTVRKESTATMLSKVQQVQERLSQLRGTEEGLQMGADLQWDAALKRAQGVKVKDDASKLKKSIKRADKEKERSRDKWAKFTEAVEKAKAEGKAIPKSMTKPKNIKTKKKAKSDAADDSGKGGKGSKGGKGGKGGKDGKKGGKGGKGGKDSEKGGKGGKGKGKKGGKGGGDDGEPTKKKGPGKDKSRLGRITQKLESVKAQHKRVKDANKELKKKKAAGKK